MPDPLRKLIRLLVGLAIAAMIWEGAVLLFGIRPYYPAAPQPILTAMAATPQAYWSTASCGHCGDADRFASGAGIGVLMASSSSAVRRCAT